MFIKQLTIIIGLLFFQFSCNVNPPIKIGSSEASEVNLNDIKLPEGFKIEIYASKVKNARAMTLSPNGTVYVGSRKEGKIYAIVDKDLDYKADEVVVIASGLKMPTGIVYVDGDLYVSEVNRVLKFIDIDQNFRKNPKGEPINFTFPSDEHHGWKYLGYGPDKKLYVPVGAPCNICEEENPVYASILRMNLDGTDAEIFASGIRNTVGFAWHPKTNELWFTDNGRDWMGDDTPPCELNHAPEKGLHFGYPYCHGSDVIDPDFGKGKNCNDYKKPVQDLGPHVAPLGMKFYTGKSFPKEYHNQVFIAEHGSWNRTKPIGYRISLVRLEGNKAVSYETFAEGWLNEDGSRWGRPVDILILNDGSMLVSDDFGDAIYRISYK